MRLSRAIEGFLVNIGAEGYAPPTVQLYQGDCGVMLNYLGDREVEEITTQDLREYFYYICNDYKPVRFGGDQSPLSPSAVDNYWKCMRAFFKWCDRELRTGRPDEGIKRPVYEDPEVNPYSKAEIIEILKAATTRDWASNERRKGFTTKLPEAVRNKAIILLLLDTGIRLGELCRLEVRDIDLEGRTVTVKPYRSSSKSKPRVIPLGNVSLNAVWKYIAEADLRPSDPLFELTPRGIQSIFSRVKTRTGIDRVYAHRFRHTFATECIRANIDVFTVKYWLGHSSLEMVMRYVNFVKSDYEAAHRRGSPGDRLLKRKRF